MGALTLPPAGAVYIDTQVVIYTVERHPVYEPILQPLWEMARQPQFQVVSSSLTLMECLVLPLRNGDSALQRAYHQLLRHSDVRLTPLTQQILLEAAGLRAAIPGLRTPDALHGATSLVQGCSLFVTNDPIFRRVPGLTVIVLDDVIAAP